MKKLLLTLVLLSALLPFVSIAAPEDTDTRLLELTKRVEVLERRFAQQPPVTKMDKGMFSGQGESQTSTFTVATKPWKISWQAEQSASDTTRFDIVVADPNKPIRHSAGIDSYNFQVSPGATRSGQTYSYIPAGTYYLMIDTGNMVRWEIWVGN